MTRNISFCISMAALGVALSTGDGVAQTAQPLQTDPVKVTAPAPSLTAPSMEDVRQQMYRTPGGVEVVPAEAFRDQRSATVKDSIIDDAFYGSCDVDDRALARTLLQPEPLLPLTTPLSLTPDRFGRIPRVYIECLQDRAIGLATQRRMIEALPCQRVLSMDSDHSPFFSAPDELVRHLLSVR